MANWQTIEFNFDIFEPLKSPIEEALKALEAIEAVLESLLELLKPFFIDVTNPLKAIVALLLASIRSIINQIESSGFSILLVHPDFNNPDFGAVLNSVTGSYPAFESKVIGKFFDTSDVFRPQYPEGSSVGMIVLYLGTDSPGDLLGLLFSLLSLIKHPIKFQGLPAPVDVKVLPIRQSGDTISQFKSLFSDDFQNQLSIEWRMPQQSSGGGTSGIFNQVSGFYNQFRFPNFIIERQGPYPYEGSGETPDTRGDIINYEVTSSTLGPKIDSLTKRYKFPKVTSSVPVREEDGSTYRKFSSIQPITFGSNGSSNSSNKGNSNGVTTDIINSGSTQLVRGMATGKYKFVDNNLEYGKTYYYRVRAFFGDASEYVNADESQIIKSGNQPIFRFKNMTLGQPSMVVKGYVPDEPAESTFIKINNLYENINRAIQAGILLNFELPRVYPQINQLSSPIPGDPSTLQTNQAGSLLDYPDNTIWRNEQRTGWGSLGQIDNQIGVLKSFVKNSEELRSNTVFLATCQRLTNRVLNSILTNQELKKIVDEKWYVIEDVIKQLEDDSSRGRTWGFVGITSGITSQTAYKIDDYLSKEDSYSSGVTITGPVPIRQIGTEGGSGKQPREVSVQSRNEIADFLMTVLSVDQASNGYMSWYSVNVGDLFPDLVPFMYDFEQFILTLLKALNSAIEEIMDIIETLISQINTLEQILNTLLQIIDILDVSVRASVLTTGPNYNGSSASLVQDLMDSVDKPTDSPYGLHSGMVMTFGGPGRGAVTAMNAIKYILGLQFL